jgi:DNA replication licensing factor MCM6
MLSLSVLHLSEVERETGQGVDRDDLITWYLEQKESQFESVAELEHEKELIGKALTKLAKVSGPHHVDAEQPIDAIICSRLSGQVPS